MLIFPNIIGIGKDLRKAEKPEMPTCKTGHEKKIVDAGMIIMPPLVEIDKTVQPPTEPNHPLGYRLLLIG